MPPNLLLKAAFVRGEPDNPERSDNIKKDVIRTNFILENIYAYLLKNTYQFDAIRAMNKKEEFILKELKETVNAFKCNYEETIKGLCSEIEVTEETMSSVLLGVSNELFCEGITWSRIIALFVFVGELTLQCLSKKFSERIVDVMYKSFFELVKDKLAPWVEDHGGWEGLRSLSVTQPGNITQGMTQTPNSGWAKSLLYSTVRMIGTLAHIANASSHAIP